MLFIIILTFIIAAKGSEDRYYHTSNCKCGVVRTVIKEKSYVQQSTWKTFTSGNYDYLLIVDVVSVKVSPGVLQGEAERAGVLQLKAFMTHLCNIL